MSFIVATKKFALVVAIANQKKQVAIEGLNVKNGDLGFRSRLANYLEKLTLTVRLHVDGDGAGLAHRRIGRPAILSRAPMRPNLMSRSFVPMKLMTRV